ncbi:MAG: hypothetical protein IH859_10485 [Chloroflexi bacterium]|nr:hypothetical protein [Chloroflexota bacterium]
MDSMIVGYTGDLIVQSEIGYILERFPEVFQVDGTDTMAITAGFEVFDSFEFGFKIDDSYNPEHALVIDPIITYGIRMAGSEFELGADIDVDDEGNVFLSAVSFSQDFPVLFPYQSEKSGQADIVVSKFDGKSGDLSLAPTGAAPEVRRDLEGPLQKLQ